MNRATDELTFNQNQLKQIKEELATSIQKNKDVELQNNSLQNTQLAVQDDIDSDEDIPESKTMKTY